VAVVRSAGDGMLTPRQFAAMFGVAVKTAARWAVEGRVHAVREGGGQRLYYRAEAEALLRGEAWEPPSEGSVPSC
jgi:predicted site-specific integrase-resolvase